MSIHLISKVGSSVNLTQLKTHLRLYDNVEDSILENIYIPSAELTFEAVTKVAIMEQQVKQIFDQFPCEDYFLLERSPYIENLTIRYYNRENELVVFDPENYIVTQNIPSCVNLEYGKCWPSDIHPTRKQAVELTYTAGIAEAGTDYEFRLAGIQHCLMMMLGDFFQNKEDSITAPGVVMIETTWSSFNLINKYKTNYYEHRSQSRIKL